MSPLSVSAVMPRPTPRTVMVPERLRAATCTPAGTSRRRSTAASPASSGRVQVHLTFSARLVQHVGRRVHLGAVAPRGQDADVTLSPGFHQDIAAQVLHVHEPHRRLDVPHRLLGARRTGSQRRSESGGQDQGQQNQLDSPFAARLPHVAQTLLSPDYCHIINLIYASRAGKDAAKYLAAWRPRVRSAPSWGFRQSVEITRQTA